MEGRKEVILIGSGVDTLSKITFDKLLKKIQDTRNVTIYTISTGFLSRQTMEAPPGTGDVHPKYGLWAGRQADERLCQDDRRMLVQSAL